MKISSFSIAPFCFRWWCFRIGFFMYNSGWTNGWCDCLPISFRIIASAALIFVFLSLLFPVTILFFFFFRCCFLRSRLFNLCGRFFRHKNRGGVIQHNAGEYYTRRAILPPSLRKLITIILLQFFFFYFGGFVLASVRWHYHFLVAVFILNYTRWFSIILIRPVISSDCNVYFIILCYWAKQLAGKVWNWSSIIKKLFWMMGCIWR